MRTSDWSSDVCSSDLVEHDVGGQHLGDAGRCDLLVRIRRRDQLATVVIHQRIRFGIDRRWVRNRGGQRETRNQEQGDGEATQQVFHEERSGGGKKPQFKRSEEHTSELQSLMRISYAVFCLQKKTQQT